MSSMGYKGRPFYGWVVVITFVIIGTILLGIQLSFGVFFKSIASEFNLTRAVTSTILSTNIILASICAFLGGWASDRYGPRIVILLMGILTGFSLLLTSQATSPWQLFITYSLLLSVGTGAAFVILAATIARWFDKKRGLALGIGGSGQGLGPVVLAPMATYFIVNLDWRMAYIVIGIIAWLTVIPLSLLLKKDPAEIGAQPDGTNSHLHDIVNIEKSSQLSTFSLLQIFKNRNFWFILFMWIFFASGKFLIFTHLVPHVTDMGFSAREAATVLSVIGLTIIAGRVLIGSVSDKIGRKLAVIICALLQAAAMIWLIYSVDLWMLYLFALFCGFTIGGFACCVGALITDTFELGTIGAAMGLLEVGAGIGGAIGPAMGGLIFDFSSSYSTAFLIAAAALLAAAVLTGLVRRTTGKHITADEGYLGS